MPYPQFTKARSWLLPSGALALATMLGGCVGYAAYPATSYNYPAGYYSGYPATYANSSYRPLYYPDYNSYYNTYSATGGSR